MPLQRVPGVRSEWGKDVNGHLANVPGAVGFDELFVIVRQGRANFRFNLAPITLGVNRMLGWRHDMSQLCQVVGHCASSPKGQATCLSANWRRGIPKG